MELNGKMPLKMLKTRLLNFLKNYAERWKMCKCKTNAENWQNSDNSALCLVATWTHYIDRNALQFWEGHIGNNQSLFTI